METMISAMNALTDESCGRMVPDRFLAAAGKILDAIETEAWSPVVHNAAGEFGDSETVEEQVQKNLF